MCAASHYVKYNGSRLTCGRRRRKGRGERQSFIVENWDSLKFFFQVAFLGEEGREGGDKEASFLGGKVD